MIVSRTGPDIQPARRTIDRTSANDLAQLATDSPGAPMQVAAILILDRSVGLAAVRAALTDRVRAVPRLRQRLLRVPFGCGRPVWVDDLGFAIDNHVFGRECPAPGDEAGLLELAALVAVQPLRRDRPLWSVTVVSGLADGRCALVLVMHHVVADGIGGLAVLAELIDDRSAAPGGRPPARPFPLPRPSTRELFVDATAARWRAARGWRSGLRTLLDAAAELRSGTAAHPPRCSLNRPTGPHRRLAVARSEVAALTAAAHEHGGTINDILLTAVGGALAAVLRRRGESAASFVVSTSVSHRQARSTPALGNEVSVLLVEVPALADPVERLAALIGITGRSRLSRERGASAALLGPMFRLSGRLGVFRWFVDRQHLVTTFVTNLRGPGTPMAFLGASITGIVPITAITGNVTVSFAALSYAGTLTVTLVADPEHCPDLPLVAAELQDQLDTLVAVQER